MIKVLITEDSPVVRGYLQYVLNSDPDIEVVGIAENGEEAIRMVEKLNPTVVTMDIHMPKMDGFEATRRIMESTPVPIVICSASWNPDEVDKTFRTMEAGAVAALEKPRGMGHPGSEASVRELVQTIKMMADVKVVKRWTKGKYNAGHPVLHKKNSEPRKSDSEFKLVAMGSSTGGPMVLQTILDGLSPDFPLPVVIVQHIAPGFLTGLGEWLSRTTNVPVHIAEDNQMLEPGHAYLAPDGFQMSITSISRIKLQHDQGDYSLCPAVSHMFESVTKSFGRQAIGVLLTGMGKDGSMELKHMRDRGAVTIAQDQESSVVHGMPGEAIKLGGASFILPPDKVAKKLNDLVKKEIKAKSVSI